MTQKYIHLMIVFFVISSIADSRARRENVQRKYQEKGETILRLKEVLQDLGKFEKSSIFTPSPLAKSMLKNWHHRGPTLEEALVVAMENNPADTILKPLHGINANRAKTFHAERIKLRGKPTKPLIIAVIDNGVNFEHEALKGLQWTNPGEIPGDGIDNDRNGFTDDVHGWDFVGKDSQGKFILDESLEITREQARCLAIPPNAYCERIKSDFEAALKKCQESHDRLAALVEHVALVDRTYPELKLQEGLDAHGALAPKQLDRNTLTKLDQWIDLSPDAVDEKMTEAVVDIYTWLLYGNYQDFKDSMQDDVGDCEKNYDIKRDITKTTPGFQPDNPIVTFEGKNAYGSSDVTGDGPWHGTHVAGIVAGNVRHVLGEAVSDYIRIMSVRVASSADARDERDEDIANAIRYAVDNIDADRHSTGIIQMSLGKEYSPRQDLVEKALRYASRKGVLVVHSAGNHRKLIDADNEFPSLYDRTKKEKFLHMINVGASTYFDGPLPKKYVTLTERKWNEPSYTQLAALVSNYSPTFVDVFAPGTLIYSPVSWEAGDNDSYASLNGTSMAAPQVTAIAAILMHLFPSLERKPAWVKSMVTASVRKPKQEVYVKPSIKKDSIKFSDMSSSGGIVDVYSAICMAAGLNCDE